MNKKTPVHTGVFFMAVPEISPQPATAFEMLQRFLQHLTIQRRLAANTVAAYGADLRSFLRFHAGGLDELSDEQIRGYFQFCHRHRISARSSARRLAALRAFFQFLVQQQALEVNPLAGLNPQDSDLVILARMAGIGYVELIGRIMASAIARIRPR